MRKHWDIICGVILGAFLSFMAGFKTDIIQQIYSIVILILVSIGFFKIVRQTIDKKCEGKKTIIDGIAENQKPLRAIKFASAPTEVGEELGKTVVKIYERSGIMKEFKNLFDKFKGYILSAALAILTVTEYCGGFINELCGGVLAINGIELVPLVTLIAAVLTGCISNPYDADQKKNIRELLKSLTANRTSTNDIVQKEIKRQVKENNEKILEYEKTIKGINKELKELEVELAEAQTVLEAKTQMAAMTPKLATDEEVTAATTVVGEIEKKITEAREKIKELEANIETVENLNSVLKSQSK